MGLCWLWQFAHNGSQGPCARGREARAGLLSSRGGARQPGRCLLAMWVLCVGGGPDQGHRVLRTEGPPHSSAWTGRRLRSECGWGPWWEELRSSCTWGPCGEAGPSWAPASCQGCSSWDAQPSSQPSLSCHFLDAIKIMGKNFHGVCLVFRSRAFEVPLWDPKTAFFTETSPHGTGDSGLRVQGCESCAVRRGWMGHVPRSPHYWGTDCPETRCVACLAESGAHSPDGRCCSVLEAPGFRVGGQVVQDLCLLSSGQVALPAQA